MNNDNICAQCGGILRLEYTIVFEQCSPHEIRLNLDNEPDRPIRLCPGHRELAQEHHDGILTTNEDRLDHHEYVVEWREAEFDGRNVAIFDQMSFSSSGTCLLWPQEALELLTWLQRNRERLETLAREQEEVRKHE